jgi:hypothetical protein
MLYNNLIKGKDRTKLRRKAWKDSCKDIPGWVAILLAATSATLSLVRGNTSTEHADYNTLVIMEFITLAISLGSDYYANIKKIENLRLLHEVNSKIEGRADGYEGGNGITKGISVPANLSLGAGLGLGAASLITFFKASTLTSTAFGAVAPLVSNGISMFTRARYQQEESVLEQVTNTTADIAAARAGGRHDCSMLTKILCPK